MKQHPTMDTLLAYLENPANADFADMRLHIATCGDCRTKLQGLTRLQESIRNTGPYQNRLEAISTALANALDKQTIERYIDGELQGPQKQSVTQLLGTDPSALKAALHYASHSASRSTTSCRLTETESIAATFLPPNPAASNFSGLMGFLKKLFDFRPPVWISVPATAIVVFAITLVVMPNWMDSNSPGLTVASYQDKPVIHYQGANQLPGIGFFNKAHRSTENFGPMDIRYDEKRTLTLHWQRVPNATNYHLALYLISEGQKITVQELNLAANQTAIADFKAEAGKRYEWTLNGETSDAKSFYTTGGFVINKQ